ncbi:glycosyltransferase [Methanolobus bombayensis]|uniref:glycosyltransferase n=1 Tax=Methanolobus bombayensis TaxID=38023 RepID=UPI001AE795BD|nr:glycosyltransferase [Methanolobus bombayensis]MBP1908198.1 cellulose synthase/poly-beta-1,6-N-acetylglucosamine synthase-like glycosyltransferase [Methanolobus bombayensis]
MNLPIALTLSVSAIPITVYFIYIIASFISKPPFTETLKSLPNVSIVIPAYNEELVIEERLKNLAESYPKDKMEIIVSNDGSNDSTKDIAKKALDDYALNGKVITHERSGVNKAINRGIEQSFNEIVVITGADGLFDENTIPDLMAVLTSSDDIGAVSGDMITYSEGDTLFSKSESAYRSIYGRICTWESNLHSTYCFNGAVVAFKKKAASSLNTRRGADDASMALSVIRNGYKCKYVPSAKFYELVPHEFSEQRRQKIRRATRLLEATIFNNDVFSPKYGKFGMIIYPLRFLMFAVVPTTFFLSLILWTLVLASMNLIYGFAFIVFIVFLVLMGNIHTNIVSSFIIYQGYLLIGLFNMLRDVHIWEPNKRTKI